VKTRREKLLEDARDQLAQSEAETEGLRKIVSLLEKMVPAQQSLELATPRREREGVHGGDQAGLRAAVNVVEGLSAPAATEDLLVRANRPLPVNEIVSVLIEKYGFGGYPYKTLRSKVYSFIGRQPDRFHKVRPGVFTVARQRRSELQESPN